MHVISIITFSDQRNNSCNLERIKSTITITISPNAFGAVQTRRKIRFDGEVWSKAEINQPANPSTKRPDIIKSNLLQPEINLKAKNEGVISMRYLLVSDNKCIWYKI